MSSIILFLLSTYTLMGYCEKTIAIQSSRETYFAYVPLTDCDQGAQEGRGQVKYQVLNANLSFNRIQDDARLTFWGVIEEGMNVMVKQKELLNDSYSQVVYFDSLVSSNLKSRGVLLTSFTLEGNIVLTEVLFNYQNGTLISKIQRTFTTNFSLPYLNYIEQCTSNQTNPQLTYIGNNSFLVLCPQTDKIFSFSTISDDLFSFSFQEGLESFQSNPLLLLPGSSLNSVQWNAVLLFNNQSNVSFCLFQQQFHNCSSFESERVWLQVFVDRNWGLQKSEQEDTYFKLQETQPFLKNVNFSGSIVSVYKLQQFFYLESLQQGQTYLTIFQNQDLLINTQLLGSISYYGKDEIVVEAQNGTYFLVSFLLPYFTISDIPSSNTKFQSRKCLNNTYETNLSIFPTNFSYPSGKVIILNNSVKTAEEGSLTYSLNQDFEVIGPDFQVFIWTNDTIETALLSSSVLDATFRIMAILQIDYLQMNKPHLLIYFLDYLGEFHLISSQTQNSQLVAKHPCGFTSISNAKKTGNEYIIYNDQGQLCICQTFLTNCTLKQIHNGIDEGSDIDLSTPSEDSPVFDEIILLEQKRLILTSPNGTVSLVTLDGEVLQQMTSNCSFGQTHALLFAQNFKDDSLLVFCEGDESISQFLVRGDNFIWKREIPLYGFIIRNNGNYYSGSSFVFLEVDFNLTYMAPNISQEMGSCCVLRIDPLAFTVSAISQIVQVQQVVFVQTKEGVDIAYYNKTALKETNSFLKVYFTQTKISFSKIPVCNKSNPCPPTSAFYYLNFASLFYNFGSTISQTVVFDLDSSSIVASPQDLSLFLTEEREEDTLYVGKEGLNFSWLCGPLMSFDVKVKEESADWQQEYIFSLQTNKVITKNKLITNLNSLILQVIDLQELLPSTDFSSFVMVVDASFISFYSKSSSEWLSLEVQQKAPIQNCYYYLYSISNSSMIDFSSNCYNYQTSIPLLTVEILPNSSLLLSYSFLNFTAQLSRVISFPQEDAPPLIFGINQGPPKAATGILAVCQEYCGVLLIQSSVDFLVDFDGVSFSEGILIIGLDVQAVNFWLNPPAPSSAGQEIVPSGVIDYRLITGQACDTVKIVQIITLQNVSFLLSCHSVYLEFEANLVNLTLELKHRFLKFVNCDSSSSTKPIFKLQNHSISLMIVECPYSKKTVEIEEIQTLTSTPIVITTAYLQVFTSSGPLCSSQDWSPIRIIPLSVTQTMNTYILYQANNTLKLLYEEISGFLIDSFVNIEPSTILTLTELTEEEEYPQLTLTLENLYYHLEYPISTQPDPSRLSIVATYILQIIFLFVNAFTLFFLLCWITCKKISKRVVKLGRVEETESSKEEPSPSSLLSGSRRASNQVPAQPARRVTQIELFQPRYN